MKIFVLAAGLACSCCILTAQQSSDLAAQQRPTDPTVRMLDEDRDPTVPVAEQEWQKKYAPSPRPSQVPLALPPAPKNPDIAPPGTVSARALKNPLSSKGRKLIQKAQDQIEKQDFVAAAKTLDDAKKLDDARPYALALSGSMELTAYIHQKDERRLNRALAALIEAVPMIPDDVAARSNLGLAYHFAGEPEKALGEASKAIQRDPARAKTRYVMGLILCDQRKYEEAAFHLKIAASEIPAANDLLRRVEQILAMRSPSMAQK